jgi:hypothetical protein
MKPPRAITERLDKLARDLVPIGFAFLILVGLIACILVFVYEVWSALNDGFTEITPGKAVSRLFIPFYSLNWTFKLMRRLPVALQRGTGRSHRPPR